MPDPVRLLFGSSRSVRALLDDVARYAAIEHPVLLLGERGTGKTVLAQHMHRLSGRPGSFVAESCPAIPPNLEQSHLAGHAKGAFTGAVEHRAGLFEAAHQGTLFLDEIGLASPALQQILLKLMDDGEIRRVGELRSRPVNVRIIGATNADLDALADDGRFRRDLLDRFGFLVIRVPRLADRREDIVPLAEQIVAAFAAQLGRDTPLLATEVTDCLMVDQWPGNVRELRELCWYAMLKSADMDIITVADLPPDFLARQGAIMRRKSGHMAAAAREALARAGGNKLRAAKLLGISRQHLYRLLAGGDS